MKAVTINISLNPELAEFARSDSEAHAFDSMSEYMRDLIRNRRQEQIDQDVAFLEKAIEGAPLGDPSDEEMAEIYASIKARRKKKMKVVFDAGVVFSGAGWRGEAHRCLMAMAHRRVVAYATGETLKELSNLLADRGDRAKHPPATTLYWYQDQVKRVEPAPLGKQRSRDVNDDPYLACALGAGAKIIVIAGWRFAGAEKALWNPNHHAA